ncbi:MerR family DNA-binding protein [Kocuria rhizophila]|nr:MerR family DNA-binding protein [Kocuria rhizophila]
MTTKALRSTNSTGRCPRCTAAPTGTAHDPPEALARLQFIRRSKAAGLSLAEIRRFLQIRDAGQAPAPT